MTRPTLILDPPETASDEKISTEQGWAQRVGIEDATYYFWATHSQDAGLRVLILTSWVAPSAIVVMMLHILFSGLELKHSLASTLVAPEILVSVATLLFIERLRSVVKRWPFVMGSLLQVCFHLVMVASSLKSSLWMPSELMRHRVFLTSYITMLTVACFQVASPVFFGFVCPLYLGAWFFFHGAVGFLPVPCVMYGIFQVCLCGYLHHLQSISLWREFEATRALEKQTRALEKQTWALEEEHQLLQAAQESLHRILAIISDASCTCDMDGQLHECSPQLKQILELSPYRDQGMEIRSRDVLNLHSFAASESESSRLKDFFANCKVHQASTIQCSFRRSTTEASLAVTDARLYAIAMPSSPNKPDVLFITLQTQSVGPIKEASEACSKALVAEMRGMLIPQSHDDVHQECNEAVHATPIDPLGVESLEGFSDLVSSTGEADPIGSLAYSQSSAEAVVVPPGERMPTIAEIEKVSVETQTLGCNLPPVAPRSFRKPRRNATSFRAKVILKTRRLVRQAFKETPSETLNQIVWDAMAQMNPRGKGCCTFHIGLQVLLCHISVMNLMECNALFMPNSGWQCRQCDSLQADIDVFDETVDTCTLCCSERPADPASPHPSISEEGSSYVADAEAHGSMADPDSPLSA